MRAGSGRRSWYEEIRRGCAILSPQRIGPAVLRRTGRARGDPNPAPDRDGADEPAHQTPHRLPDLRRRADRPGRLERVAPAYFGDVASSVSLRCLSNNLFRLLHLLGHLTARRLPRPAHRDGRRGAGYGRVTQRVGMAEGERSCNAYMGARARLPLGPMRPHDGVCGWPIRTAFSDDCTR